MREKERKELDALGHDGRMALVNSIDVDAKYFTDYTITNDGERIDKTDIVEGAFLTEGQLLRAEKIPT